MNATIPIIKSDRTFKLWEYQISHGQLLIRSPKAPATDTSPEMLTNLDLVCLGVDYLAVPRIFHGLELVDPTFGETESISLLLGRAIRPEALVVIASGGKRFPIVASSYRMAENDWDIFESPFKFRSRFRET